MKSDINSPWWEGLWNKLGVEERSITNSESADDDKVPSAKDGKSEGKDCVCRTV